MSVHIRLYRLTRIDLLSEKPQSGLGPLNMRDLGIILEDFGLQQPIIIKDCASPADDNTKYGGANIQQADIKKCRPLWLNKEKQPLNPLEGSTPKLHGGIPS